MNPTTIQPLTRTSLEKFDQVAARANTPPHPGQTASLKEVKKAVYALAWQLSRIGEAGHRILDAEEIAVIGPDEVQSVPHRNLDLEPDEITFWEAKRRHLESHTGTIKLERVKGWVYMTVTGLRDLGEDGHRVLERAGVSLASCRKVRYRPPPGEPDLKLNDETSFWEHKLQHLEQEYKQLRRKQKKPPAVAIEFLSSDSEVEEDQAAHARAEEYVFGWQDRMENIEAWVEAASTVKDMPCATALIQDPASLHADSGDGSWMTSAKRTQSTSPTQSGGSTRRSKYSSQIWPKRSV
ncbi:hypothetical protein ColTof4_08728 [Colletotrichum tofieldiae]|nr:hypothetical protein ColTof3_04068 [Colletotrichum tofieldiae]GKT76305.1 hypothetical protein ColTof4_08728 [Colletotrichum tofieldiae]